jgi:(S)-sulfolactate dehydrogenase
LARGLGLSVIAHDPMLADDAPVYRALAVSPVGLDALLAEADVISLHLPLTADTRRLFDADRLKMIKTGAILINTARGGIIDEAALAERLREGQLAGAALDVFEDEPLPAGSVLAGAPNLLLTPHIAGLTVESNNRVSLMVARRVDETLRLSKALAAG